MRLFVGVEFPDQILAQLAQLQEKLRGQARKGRFVAGSNLHLTLQFLGEVPSSRIGALADALSGAVQMTAPFTLSFGKFGIFGRGDPYRVIWLGFQGDLHPLTVLRQKVAQAMSRLNYPDEGRSYCPHVTLARDVSFADGKWEDTPLTSGLEGFLVEHIALMASSLEAGRRIYRPVKRFQLRNG